MELNCYGTDLSLADCEMLHDHRRPRAPLDYTGCDRGVGSGRAHDLKPSEISLVVNWAAAAKQAVHAGHRVVMILESDVLFDDDFLPKLTDALKVLEGRPWDFLSISAGAGLRPARGPDGDSIGWFPPINSYYHTRTTDAMIVKVTMLDKIVDSLFPFVDVLDWELNYQLSLNKSVSLWLDPPIVRQGSGNTYATTLT
jgi:hypothetical protein